MRALILMVVLVMACGGPEEWRGNEVTFGLTQTGCGVPACSGETTWGGSLDPVSTWYDCQWPCGDYLGTARTYVHVGFVRDPAGVPGCGWRVNSVEATPELANCPAD